MSTETQDNDYADPQAFAEAAKAQSGVDFDDGDSDDHQNGESDSAQGARNGSQNYQGYVDLSSLPEEIRKPVEARFSHLSQLHRKTESKYEGKLRQYEDLLRQQSEALTELQNGFGTFAGEMYNRSYAEREAGLEQQIKDAFENGDISALNKAQMALFELRQQKKDTEKQQKQPPKQQQPRQPMSAQQMGQESDLPPEEAEYLSAWADERDANGNFARPWAQNSDPNYVAALYEAQAVFGNPAYNNLTFQQKMAELDRRMGMKTAQVQPKRTTMGGGLTGRGGNPTMQLTPEQKKIAVKMKFGGSQAKSEDEHLEAYRKQLQSIRKGAR